jgi:hypothetical protein
MNEFGEPDIGTPSVRFDEGREMFWALACAPLNLASPAYLTTVMKTFLSNALDVR